MSSKRNADQADLVNEDKKSGKRNRQQENDTGTATLKASSEDTQFNPENCSTGKSRHQAEQETVFFLRMIYMFIDLGTEIAHSVFLYLTKNDIVSFLNTKESKEKLRSLRNKKVLSVKEYSLVTRDPAHLKPNEFDISLLITLILNLLPRDKLPEPNSGWGNPLSENDFSFSADILRLRKIRNGIVAHQPKPKIPEWKFNKFWQQTAEVILRLTRIISPGDEVERAMNARIDTYKVCVLDIKGIKQQYQTIIDEWSMAHEERMEKLFETRNEFESYFKEKSDRYERYIKLLSEGGQLVLHGILKREVSKKSTNVTGKLAQNENNLEGLASSVVRKMDECEDMQDKSKWDILRLANVLMTDFSKSLNPNETTEIKRIKDAMENHAEAAITALDKDRFLSIWTDLVSSLKCLSMALDANLKQKCDELIDVCLHKVDVDISQLLRDYSNLKSIKDVYNEYVQKLKESLDSMLELQVPFREPQTLEVKFDFHGDIETTKMAEKVFLTVWNEALKRVKDSTNMGDVRLEVEKILTEIRGTPGVTDVEVAHHCIIVTIKCNSPNSILGLLDYVENDSFQQSVKSLEHQLYNMFDEVFVMTANFTLDSLHDVEAKISSDRHIRDSETEVSCPITFSSAEGMMAVWSLLKSKAIEDSTSKISESLSESLGGKITIKTNMKGFHHLFEETESDTPVSLCGSTTEDVIQPRGLIEGTIDDSEDLNNSVKNNSSIVSDDHSSPDCEYEILRMDDIETDNSNTNETAKANNLQFDILTKSEQGHVPIQSQKDIWFQDDGHRKASITNNDSVCHTQTQISVGDSIRPQGKQSYGTVGPFVKIKETGEMCFLTVRHIFGRLIKRDHEIIGTKVIHRLSVHKNSDENERVCGEVIASEYSENLDAALVKLSEDHIPNRYSFATISEEQSNRAGICMLKYANIHSVIDVQSQNPNEIRQMQVIKIGSASGLTKGSLRFKNKKVKTENTTILSEEPKLMIMEAVPYQNHIHVEEIRDSFASALGEDDGAAVYLLDDKCQLHCMGMLCRRMIAEGAYLVGQIGIILERLGKQIRMTLEIDKYEQVEDTIDPYDKELFNHTLQDGYECDRQIRVNIIGFFAQGKTTLTRRLVNEPLDDIACTDGIEVYVRTCKMHGNNWTTCDTVDMYEDCSRRLVDVVKREQRNPLECKDESPPSFESDHVLALSSIRKDRNGTANVNKDESSLVDMEVVTSVNLAHVAPATKDPETELKRLFSKHLRDTDDDKDSDGLWANVWDFGGQFIYYATHQIFHSRDAIYLLVFDLTKDLDTVIIDCDFPDRQEKMKNSLMFWVNSIHAFVGGEDTDGGLEPIVILVGTHKDKFMGDVNAKLKDVFDLFSGTKLQKHIYNKPFAISSLDQEDEGVDILKSTIYEIGMKKVSRRKIPAKWVPLEISLLEIRDKKQILKFEEILAIDAQNTHPIFDESQIKKFLNYHHDKGTIVYFDEQYLNQHVVLNPQFLINAFKCIITAKWFCRWNRNVQDNHKKLKREGILEMDLLDAVWSQDKVYNFIENKDILLMFLERHRILAEIRRMDENTGDIQLLGKYMIPSMLKRDLDRNAMDEFLQGKQYTQVILGLELEDAVSATVFEKVTAALLGKWPPIEYKEQVLVFQNAGLYRLGLQHVGQITKTDESIELMVINSCPPDQADSIVCDRFRRYVEMVIAYECRRNHFHYQEKPYEHYLKCNDPQHKGVGSRHFHYMKDIRNHMRVCCPDNGSHPIAVQKAITLWFQGKCISDMETNAIRKATKEDKLVTRIAQEYGKNWNLFGIAIGLSSDDLTPIGVQGEEVTVRILAMFKIWRKKYPNDTSYKIKRKNWMYDDSGVDWDRMRNCFEF